MYSSSQSKFSVFAVLFLFFAVSAFSPCSASNTTLWDIDRDSSSKTSDILLITGVALSAIALVAIALKSNKNDASSDSSNTALTIPVLEPQTTEPDTRKSGTAYSDSSSAPATKDESPFLHRKWPAPEPGGCSILTPETMFSF